MLTKLKGYRTYATMAVIIILALVDGWNEYCTTQEAANFCFNISVPESVFAVLAALGIYTRKLANTGR